MKKSDLEEKLATLYLRLNGYFTTGFVIQSSKINKVDGEIDVIAVRFMNHSQEDREVESDDYLQIPTDTKIDLIIGEVKASKNIKFNASISDNKDRRIKLLKWIGLFEKEDINNLSSTKKRRK